MEKDRQEELYKFISIDKLELDKENPRIAKKDRNKDDYDILKGMWKSFSLEDLIISIDQNGFIPAEPLMVVKKDDENDKYIVVEGNRRLSAVMLLTDKKYKNDSFFADKLSPYKNQEIKELPCYIFDKKEDIENALAVRHISGIKKWDAKEKAEFAIRLYKKENNIKNVTKIIGSKTNTIGALIYSYFWLEYLIESEENRRNDLENLFENKFSLLNLALGQSNIRNFLNINDKWDTIDYNVRKYEKGSKEYDNMLYLCLWLSDYKIISDSRQITGGKTNPVSLSAILADNEATNYLKIRTDANSELPNLLVEAYNRIAVDSNLVVRFEETYNKINQLMYIYKDKKNNLSDKTIEEINRYCDNIKNIVSTNN